MMLELDESDLTLFFGELPEEQSADDLEFFSAPLFVKHVDGMTLTFSASLSHKDVRLDLAREGFKGHLLHYVLLDVVSLSIQDDADGRSWLRAVSNANGRMEISVQPTIEVAIHNDGHAV